MARRTDAATDWRIQRIRVLARKLEDTTALNTEHSTARCRRLSLEILELLDEEDEQRRAKPLEPSSLAVDPAR